MNLPQHASQAAGAIHAFRLEVPHGARRKLAVAWLMLALASLVASGFFSILLVLARRVILTRVTP